MYIDVATIDYKQCWELSQIAEYFYLPKTHHHHGVFTIRAVKTIDNYYILVTLSEKSVSTEKTKMIDGTSEDNVQVQNAPDLFKSHYIELNKEAGIIQDDTSKNHLKVVFEASKTHVGCYFETTLSTTEGSLLKKFANYSIDQNIHSLLFFTKNEYIKILKQHSSPNKNILAKMVSI